MKFKTPIQLVKAIYGRLYYYCCPDKIYLNNKFKEVFGRDINWESPKTYNEKLQWIKIYDRNPLYTQLVDKYEVRKYIEEIIGNKYLIPCLGVWEKFSDIDFEKLPRQFVLKCTHDSSSVMICKDKNKFEKSKAELFYNERLKKNFFYNMREWPYKNVKPRIIAEQVIGTEKTPPIDYKFYCFDGKIDCVMVCVERNGGRAKYLYYDMNWNRLQYQVNEPIVNQEISKPENFEEMIEVVNKLQNGRGSIRVDLYNVDGKIYFGELTFFNMGGFDTDITYETDLRWGKMMSLKRQNK